MFNNITYIDYLLMLKDEEINENFLKLNEIFKQYISHKISKEYLLDKHTERNKLFIDWVNIYNYSLYLRKK